MKKILLFALPLMVMCFASCEKDNGKGEELSGDDIIQFEDPNFLKALLYVQEIEMYDPDGPDADSDGYVLYTVDVDTNKDGQISVNEAKKVRGLQLWYYDYDIDADDLQSFNVKEMSEIKYFTALTYLECYGNQLTSLDLSKNTALTYLYCSDNQLTTLDVSKNTALTYLNCYGNQLTSLDLSKNTALTDLNCSDNQLTSLDLSKNTALTYLSCYSNQLTTLDVSKNTALTYLNCYGNQLTSLDLSKNTALTDLYCSDNQLTSLDLSKNTALEYLECSENPLTKIILNRNNKFNDFYIQSIIYEYGEDIIEYVE